MVFHYCIYLFKVIYYTKSFEYFIMATFYITRHLKIQGLVGCVAFSVIFFFPINVRWNILNCRIFDCTTIIPWNFYISHNNKSHTKYQYELNFLLNACVKSTLNFCCEKLFFHCKPSCARVTNAVRSFSFTLLFHHCIHIKVLNGN